MTSDVLFMSSQTIKDRCQHSIYCELPAVNIPNRLEINHNFITYTCYIAGYASRKSYDKSSGAHAASRPSCFSRANESRGVGVPRKMALMVERVHMSSQ